MNKKVDRAIKGFKIAAIIFGALIVLAFILLVASNSYDYTKIRPMITSAVVFICVGVAGLICDLFAYLLYSAYSPNMIAERKKNEEETKARLQKQQEKEDWKLHNIKKTAIIHTATKKDKDNTMTRGVIGGWLFGATGAVVGTATGKENEFTTFLIVYSDDSRETKEVQNGSAEYNLYIQHLEV